MWLSRLQRIDTRFANFAYSTAFLQITPLIHPFIRSIIAFFHLSFIPSMHHPFVQQSTHHSVLASIYPYSFPRVFIRLSTHPVIFVSIHLSITGNHNPSLNLSRTESKSQSIYLSLYPSIHPSIHLYVCLSIHPSIRLSIHPSAQSSDILLLGLPVSSACFIDRESWLKHPSIHLPTDRQPPELPPPMALTCIRVLDFLSQNTDA